MDFKKVFLDFDKRYGEKCCNAFFVGMPISFFERAGASLGCCLSVGVCIMISPREDGRIIIGFSDTDKIITCNVIELAKHTDGQLLNGLFTAQKAGAEVGGARILFYFNSDISRPQLPALLASLKAFCKNVPPQKNLIAHFDDFEQNSICLSGVKNTVTMLNAGSSSYYPFPDSRLKIVICKVHENGRLDKCVDSDFSRPKAAADALASGDFAEFGRLLTLESQLVLKKNKRVCGKTHTLFDMSDKLGDALGVGLLENGGIFAVVENAKVDTFMHNLGAEYEKRVGKRPDFYVTDTENSGSEVSVQE